MTDRHAGYIITLAQDVREDDAKEILTALRMIKGVLSVEPIIADFDLHMAQERVRSEYRTKLIEFIRSLDQ
jgi:hypothetical protein